MDADHTYEVKQTYRVDIYFPWMTKDQSREDSLIKSARLQHIITIAVTFLLSINII